MRDARVDAVGIAFRAALAPADKPHLPGAALGIGHDQRPAAVALTAVLAALLEAGADLAGADGGVRIAALARRLCHRLDRGSQEPRPPSVGRHPYGGRASAM